MNRWYAGLVALLIVGCGVNSNSNSDLFGGRAEELDGGDDRPSLQGKDLEAISSTPLFREFDVDLFSSAPIQRVTNLNISSADTYKISLQTLDLLTEEKRFPLIQADKIIQNGVPKVIAPIGYTVSLEVSENQVVAVIKSTTQPEKVVQPAPIYTDSNDIIVGDLRSLNLLVSSIQHTLCSCTAEPGLTSYATAFNGYVTYSTADQWSVGLVKRHVGMNRTLGGQIGKDFNVFDRGVLGVSMQTVYGVRECKHINVASLKYSTSGDFGVQGHVMAATILDLTCYTAVGVGCSLCPLTRSCLALGMVISHLDWNASLDFRLEF